MKWILWSFFDAHFYKHWIHQDRSNQPYGFLPNAFIFWNFALFDRSNFTQMSIIHKTLPIQIDRMFIAQSICNDQATKVECYFIQSP